MRFALGLKGEALGFVSAVFFLAVCFGVPLGALAWCLLRERKLTGVFFLGVASFLVSQVLLRLPLLEALGNTAWFAVFSATQPMLYILALAASAALFEETARFLLLRPQRTRAFDLRVPLVFGIGHGGLEALLTGVGVAPLLFTSPEQAGLLGGALFVSGFERLSAMACHVAFTFLVYYAVMRRKPAAFGLALLLHCLVDVGAGLASMALIPLFLFELLLAVFAVAQLWLVFKFVSKRKDSI